MSDGGPLLTEVLPANDTAVFFAVSSPDAWGQLRGVVRYQLVNLFSGATDDGQPLSQGRFESHGATHGFASPGGG